MHVAAVETRTTPKTTTTSSLPSKLSAYDPVIERQQRRIDELETELERSKAKLELLKSRHQLTNICDAAQNPSAASSLWNHPYANHQCRGGLIQGLPAPLTAEEDERAGKTRYWTEIEHNQFLWAVTCFGPKNYVAISQFVGTRTPKQVRTHAQKYQMKLEREASKRRATAAALAAANAEGDGNKDDGKEDKGMGNCSGKGGECEMASHDVGSAMTAPPPASAVGMQTGLDWLRELSCSPVSGDSSEEELMLGELEEESMIPSTSLSLKKNTSIANLADYDNFYKKLNNAADEKMTDNDDSPYGNGDEVMGPSQPEGSRFEDSLLALDQSS